MSVPRAAAAHDSIVPAGRYRGEPFAIPGAVAPQHCACGAAGGACRCNGNGATRAIYLKGQFDPVFPSLSVEREFHQALPPSPPQPNPPPLRRVIYQLLRQTRYIYIAREMCWVFKIEGIESYIVRPTSYAQLTALISAIAQRDGTTFDVLMGHGGGPARPELCNGRKLPLATPKFLYSFTIEGMANVIVVYLKSLKHTADVAWAKSAVTQMLQLTDNDGVTDGHRAMNFVALRYLGLYVTLWQMHQNKLTLKRVRTLPARVQGARTIVSVIFTFGHEASAGTGEEWYCRVDTTSVFPVLVGAMGKYFERP